MIRPVLIALLAAISLGAPAWAHEVKAGDLTLQHLAVRATFGGLPTSAGYVLIVNAGTRPDRLLSVSCDCAKAVQIHLSEMKGAVASMRQQAFVDIPAGGKVEFKPDGLHLMLVGLKAPLVDGTMQQMTLRFARAGTVKAGFHVKARIEAEGPAAAPAMGDMPAMAH
jgi:copper(I)-binding protein